MNCEEVTVAIKQTDIGMHALVGGCGIKRVYRLLAQPVVVVDTHRPRDMVEIAFWVAVVPNRSNKCRERLE